MSGLMGLLLWLVTTAFDLYSLLLVARVVASWLNVSPYHPAIRFLVETTEPVLRPLRRRFPPRGGVDFSPLLALLALWAARNVATRLLLWVAG